MEIIASTSKMLTDFDVPLEAKIAINFTIHNFENTQHGNGALNAVVATLTSPMLGFLRLERENQELI